MKNDYRDTYVIHSIDKNELVNYINIINKILKKYPHTTESMVSVLNRAKGSANDLSEWINLLSDANLTWENNMYIDYEHFMRGYRQVDHKKVFGYRAFDKDYHFVGLLDENKNAIWYIDIGTLKEEEKVNA